MAENRRRGEAPKSRVFPEEVINRLCNPFGVAFDADFMGKANPKLVDETLRR